MPATINPPCYAELIEACEFRPRGEIVSGDLNAETEFPQKLHQIANTIRERRGLHVADYGSKRDLRVLVPKLQELYNCALVGTTGNVLLTKAEAKTLFTGRI